MEPELAPVVLVEARLEEEALELCSLASTQLHGKVTGHVHLVLQSGCVYDGQVERSCMHGKGTMVFPDGLQYQGDFQQNVIQGTGVYQWPGGARYEGEVVCGLRHGKGRMSFADSSVVYEGSWHQGLRHGHGKVTFNKEGTHWYEGDWQHDQKWGHGVMRYANGDKYEGAWARDGKCGHGVMTWDSRKERYEGLWDRNAPNGVGTHTWFQQLVTEPSPSNHALLVLFNRYEGQFLDGARHGYGALHYATGARYEGHWSKDLKQGLGIVVFENGEVWQGIFTDDQPVLGEGEVFAPKGPGLSMQVEDLIDEEEVPLAAARGVANVLMVYNTDLRSLYDKYCKRPSLHSRNTPRPSFTMLSCQVWELLGDVRLITAATPLSRVNELLALARRPPAALTAFRAAHRPSACQSQQAAEPSQAGACSAVWWQEVCQDHGDTRVHDPMQELLFREFAEFLVRLAAARYRHVPGLERRLHTLINVHLLHQVSKTKATLPPPPRTPFHLEMWAGNATAVLHACAALLRQAWTCVGMPLSLPEPAAGTLDGSADDQQPAADSLQAGSQQMAEQQQEALNNSAGEGLALAGEEHPTTASSAHGQSSTSNLATAPVNDAQVYGSVKSVRQALQLLQELGLLASPALAMQAAAALTFNYLTINTYTFEPSRAKVEMEGAVASPQTPPMAIADLTDGLTGIDASKQDGTAGVGAGGAGDASHVSTVPELADADAREVLCWLDQPMLYADWVEGVARVAQGVVAASFGTVQQGTGNIAGAAGSVEGSSGAGVPIQPVVGAGQQQEGVLHRQLRQFLTGEQGLQKALEAALLHQNHQQMASV